MTSNLMHKLMLAAILFDLVLLCAFNADCVPPSHRQRSRSKNEFRLRAKVNRTEVKVVTSRLNIILIVVDDVGWNDVGWHNDDVITPNLNRLAQEGVVLNASYVTPICTPSRAAILTGIYPFRLGLQHGVLKRTKPHGLPLNVTTLPQYLKSLGYVTHGIGKWHLGFCNWSYTPTFRGFHSFFGFYTGQQDYYTHRTTGNERGYDLRYNRNVFKSITPKYSTTMFGKHAADVIMTHSRKKPFFIYLAFPAAHTPLQVPVKYESLYRHVTNKKRRKYLAMVTAVDEAVGDVIKALRRRNVINNTLIVFISDNGASPYGSGNNWPLRGGKATLWEGGTRVPTFVWCRMLNKTKYVNNGLIHAVDWMPTLLSAASNNNNSTYWDINIDGRTQWNMIQYGEQSTRTEFVYNLNHVTGQAAIRQFHVPHFNGDFLALSPEVAGIRFIYPGGMKDRADLSKDAVNTLPCKPLNGRYKLIEGSAGHYDNWFQPSTRRADNISALKQSSRRQNRHTNQTLLYDVIADPIEVNDLSFTHPDVVTSLRHQLNEYRKLEVPALNPRPVRYGLPKYWNGVWSPGWC